MAIDKYINLLKYFVLERISANEFERNFLQLFKSETGLFLEEEFQILDKLFGDVDAYCSDLNLIRDPQIDITEEELRLCATEALNKLEELVKM